MPTREMKNGIAMDACYTNSSIPLLKHFRLLTIIVTLALILTGCKNYVGVQVSGAIGDFKLTNNGTDEITIDSNKLYIFPKGLDAGDQYNVEVVPGSDTSEGHQCLVTGGSGTMVSGGVTVIVKCDGV